jgi:hypothetical protein
MIRLMKLLFLLQFILTLSFSLPSFGNECTDIFSKLAKIETNKSIEFKLVHKAPQKTILKITEDLPSRIFLKTKNDFIENLNNDFVQGSFELVIEKIKKGKLIKNLQSSEEDYRELLIEMKSKRKHAAILRSVFIVFTDEHKSPKNFEQFTKSFGKFNDSLDFKAFNRLPDSARKLEESYNRTKILKELDHFKSASSDSIIKNLDETKNEVLNNLKKEELSIEEFHETRKLLKHYLTTIQMIIQVDENKELSKAFNFLNELNDSLGNLRDENLKKEIEAVNAGKKVKLSKTEVIPENYKKNIKIFFNGLIFE